jgi:hypothetical protein
LLSPGLLRSEEIALFTVDVKLSGSGVDQLDVVLSCDREPPLEFRLTVPVDTTRTFTVPAPPDRGMSCTVDTQAPTGHQLAFAGDGGSRFDPDGAGCTFSDVRRGHTNFCQIKIANEKTTLAVYKRWIGTSEKEPDVEISLDCGTGESYRPLRINADRPGEWELQVSDPDGISCSVTEQRSDAYVDDVSDCRDLLILSGASEECTIVNTRVVKMIEMLNRYGLAVMVLAFMVVGGLAARKMLP